MIRVAFVCLGNICRSPLAEGAFRALVERGGHGERFHIESAGTGDWHVGRGADDRSVRVARSRGLDISTHRAKQFTKKDFERFDHVIAMDRANVAALSAMAPSAEARAKIKLFRSFDADEHGEVPDPYYGNAADFESVLDLCMASSEAMLRALVRERT